MLQKCSLDADDLFRTTCCSTEEIEQESIWESNATCKNVPKPPLGDPAGSAHMENDPGILPSKEDVPP